MNLLELQSVGARYGPIKALHDVSLAVEQGELVAVLEPFSRRSALRGRTNRFHSFLLAERPVHEQEGGNFRIGCRSEHAGKQINRGATLMVGHDPEQIGLAFAF